MADNLRFLELTTCKQFPFFRIGDMHTIPVFQNWMADNPRFLETVYNPRFSQLATVDNVHFSKLVTVDHPRFLELATADNSRLLDNPRFSKLATSRQSPFFRISDE